MDLFTLTASLTLDAKQYESGIASSKKSFEGLAKSISAKSVAVGTLVAHALESAGRTLFSFAKSAVQNAADIEAEAAMVSATFGDLEMAANGTFESISNDTKILASLLRTTGVKAFSQFKGAGLDATTSLGMMEKYTRLTADAAAYYNMSLEEVDTRLRSFIRGNTEAGDMLGLFTSEADRNSRALEKYGAKWLELTEAQKQMLMLDTAEQIFGQSGVIGQAAREGDSFQVALQNLSEAWRQFTGMIGKPFEESVTPFLQKMSDLLSDDTVRMRFGMLFAGLGDLAGKAFDGAIALIDEFIAWSNGEGNSALMDALQNVLGHLSNIAGGLFKGPIELVQLLFSDPEGDAMENVAAFFSDLKAFSDSEAVQTILGFLGGLLAGILLLNHPITLITAGLALIVTHWQEIKDWAEKAYNAISEALGTFYTDNVSPIIDGISSALSGLWDMITKVSNALAKLFSIKVDPNFEGGIDYDPDSSSVPGNLGEYAYGWSSDYDTGGSTIFGKGHAVGFDYVPYNDYFARLHEGEAVLTKAEATAWRRNGMQIGGQSGSMTSSDAQTIGTIIASAVVGALNGMDVRFGEDVVGRVFAPQISRELQAQGWKERYA